VSHPDPLAVIRGTPFGAYLLLYHLVGTHALRFYNDVRVIGLDRWWIF